MERFLLKFSHQLRAELLELRGQQLAHTYPDDFLTREEVVRLAYDFNVTYYLSFKGTVFKEDCRYDKEPLACPVINLKEISAAIVIGAKQQKMPQLLDLLPRCPGDRNECSNCKGTRWMKRGDHDAICLVCSGLGWE